MCQSVIQFLSILLENCDDCHFDAESLFASILLSEIDVGNIN